jgi:hypothetical protein
LHSSCPALWHTWGNCPSSNGGGGGGGGMSMNINMSTVVLANTVSASLSSTTAYVKNRLP